MTRSTKPPRATIRLLTAVLVTLSVLLSQFAPAGAAPTYRHVASWSAALSIDGDHAHGVANPVVSLAGEHGATDSSCSSDCPVKYVAVAFGALTSDSPKARIPSHVAELIGRPVAAGVGPPRA
ncbi:hypothetical protein [Aurantimonas marianensis]|uniref:Uncharacterized protein n=1 Tax=Aurantimonas marianensis TaxID=2920428 RepID=A0A9X2HBJ8_9HYPH|nr:hypothetical protein [Aurantimonas marianensis]MCP3056703.1 hypothetical protein [Aurantimonas marianensis]